MEIDDGSSVVHAPPRPETLFAKSDELSVAFYANLPVEVKQVLKNAGEYDVYLHCYADCSLALMYRLLWRFVLGCH